MDDSTQTVVSTLAEGFGLPEQDVKFAMEHDETVADRVERIASGDGTEVDIETLHADVKLVLIGEEPT